MKYHNELIRIINEKKTSGFNLSSFSDTLIISKLLMHLSDLSNQMRPYNICAQWSSALKREFKNQIKKEEDKNFNVLEFMKISDDKSYYLSEYNFANFIVLPLVNVSIEVFQSFEMFKITLSDNIKSWKELSEINYVKY